MPHWILKYDIENWWERRCNEFIQQEAKLQHKIFRVVKSVVFYSETVSDQYEIFWIIFLEEVFQWLEKHQEEP
jgi:hypothetical protein